jgi:alkylglycerol monooxygenase
MEAYAAALLYAIPAFSILVILEALYIRFFKKLDLNHMDMISSLSSGITNVIKDSFGILIIILSYPFLVSKISVTDLDNLSYGLTFFIAFIAYDFASYWNHRLNHKVNIFWNRHVIHHSSEEFNLPCALRQTVSVFFGFFAVFLIPAAIIGVPAEIIVVLAPIHLFMQFWYHTVHIPKLGFLEYILVTPSQHRVHHAINPEYIDKNLSAIFCIWDRIFGTFQEELDEVPCVFGVLKPAETWNPLHINFQHSWRIIKDAWRTKDWLAKFTIWFKPTGWRPSDVVEKYPVDCITDVYDFKKYDLQPKPLLILWSYFQLTINGLLLLFLFYNISEIAENKNLMFLYGFIIVAGIYGYTTIMDEKPYGLWIEIIRSGLAIACIWKTADWFGLNSYFGVGSLLVGIYYILTIAGVFYFTQIEFKRSKNKSPVEKQTLAGSEV